MKSNKSINSVEAVENVYKIEKIEPYYKRDVKLVRKTDQFGNVNYYRLHDGREIGEEIFVHHGCIESEMRSIIEGLKVIEDAAQSRQEFEIWSALTAIRRKAEERIDEIFRIVEQEIGDIEIYSVGDNGSQSILRYGQVVGAMIAPPEKFIERPISMVTLTTQS